MSNASEQSNTVSPSPESVSAPYRTSAAIIVCCVAFFLVTLDATIVNSALYSMQHEFTAKMSAIQWIVDAYTIALAALMLSTGAVADRLGANRLLRLGFSVFLVASIGCSAAQSILMLIALRVVQGVGAALMLPASLALMSKSVESDKARVRATSLWAAAGGVAVVLGPVLGGLLTTAVGWRSVFLINIPVCALCLIHLFRRRADEPSGQRGLDITGQILATVLLVAVTAGIVEFRNSTNLAVALLIAGAVAGCAFFLHENRVADPAFPLSLWRNKVFDSCAFTGFALNFSYFGSIFVLAILFQQSYKYSPAGAGLLFIPLTIFIMAANLMSGKIAERRGTFGLLFWGQLVEGFGFLVIAYAIATRSLGIMMVGMLLVGIGAGTASPPMMAALMSSVNHQDAGLAAGALNCLRQFGTVLGVAVFGLIIEGSPETGSAISLIASGIILFLSGAMTWLLVPRHAGD